MEELLDFPLDVEALSVSELSYELKLRNVAADGTGRQKATLLRKAMETEKEPPLHSVSDEEDFNKAIEMLGDLQKELKAAIKTGDEAAERKVKSRIRHYQDRAFRAAGESEETDSILYGAVRSIKRTLRMSAEESQPSPNPTQQTSDPGLSTPILKGGERVPPMGRGRGKKPTTPSNMRGLSPFTRREPDKQRMTKEHGAPSAYQERVEMPLVAQKEDGELYDRRFESHKVRDANDLGRGTLPDQGGYAPRLADSEKPRFIERRKVAMEKWPVRFSGSGALSLTDFLNKVQLYAEADDVEWRDVYRGIFKLLEGIALEWYEVNAHFINSWEDLVRRLKARFLSKNYDYMVREEILERRQSKEEPSADYLMHMTKLFLKVYPPLDEGYKVYVLQRNMLAHYRLQLTVADVSSVAQLEKLCKNMDEARLMDTRQQHQNQPSQAQPVVTAPIRRSLYRRNDVRNVEAVEISHRDVPHESRFARRQQINRNNSIIKCWNCLQPGHRHFDCDKPKERIYCWCCGMEGFRADQCPRNHRGGRLFTNIESPTQNPPNRPENSNLGE